jgi:Holliday junction resolvase RusA-like endonuclease
MSELLSFVVPGAPVPKQRARRGNGGHWYTPQETVDYETSVSVRGMVARIRERWQKDDHWSRFAVSMDMFFPDERTRDIDNVCKSVLDGLNCNIWHDDRQVERLVITRHIDRVAPRTEIEIERLEPDAPAGVGEP